MSNQVELETIIAVNQEYKRKDPPPSTRAA